MSLDARIYYKDPGRARWSHPFCPQSVLREFWWPTAQKHRLQLLQRMECLFVADRDEPNRMIRELRFVAGLLRRPDHAGLSVEEAGMILERLEIAMTAFEGALTKWHNVEYTTL